MVGKALKALFRGKETRFGGILRRNVVLPGASGAAHEIDLVLDAPLAGRTWHVAVECKDHARPVEKETAAGFRAVLLDVNERLPEEEKMTGMLVSRSGFQSGAIALAGHCGICLMEIREPDEREWRRYARRFSAEGQAAGLKEIDLRLRCNERIRLIPEPSGSEDSRGAERDLWRLDTPLGWDPYSMLLYKNGCYNEILTDMLEQVAVRNSGNQRGVHRKTLVKTPGGRVRHLIYGKEIPVSGIEFSYDDLSREARDAVLFSRERPDLIVNLPRSSRQWGIWNGKAHLIPDPIEAIRTWNL